LGPISAVDVETKFVNSHIGYGAPHKHNSNAAHGEPLGEEKARLAKRNYGWPEDARFLVPDGVCEHFRDGIGKRDRVFPPSVKARVSVEKGRCLAGTIMLA
jgi:transketolase